MRVFAQLVGVLLVVGFRAYWWFIVLTVCAIAGAWLSVRAYQQHRIDAGTERRRVAAVAARADEQHCLVMCGDELGLYGHYPPAF